MLVFFYNPWKHQKTSGFLIYGLITDMSLSTMEYLRDLCLKLLVKRKVWLTSENSFYKKIFFANECKHFYALCCKRRSQRWNLYDWGCYLYFSLVCMFKELIFVNLKRSVLVRVFFIKNTQRKINSGVPLQAALEWINWKHHWPLDSESQATKNIYVDGKKMEIGASLWNAFSPYLFK